MEGKNILTPERVRVLELVAKEPRLANFYLSGGTALSAFYFQHRDSEDLDFFCFETINVSLIHEFMDMVKKDLGAKTMRYDKVFYRNLFFLTLADKTEFKLEFTKYPFKHLGKISKKFGVPIDSLRDIAANKFMALIERFDPKDFVDMYFLLERYSLSAIRRDAEKKFGSKIGDMGVGSEFAKVRRIEALPRMLKPLTIGKVKVFFANEARKLGTSFLL